MSSYREFPSRPELDEVVACTWTRAAPAPAVGDELRILPDGCLDLVWSGEELLVAAPDRTARIHRVEQAGDYVGVRLRPGTAGAVIGWPVDALPGGVSPLDTIWGPPARMLAEQLAEAPDARDRRRLLEAALLRRLQSTAQLDRLVIQAVGLLDRPRGRVAELSPLISLGSRQLQRRFRQQVGYGPKFLARVLRLHRLLTRSGGTAVAPPTVQLASLASELGYTDQAHLTRDCRELSGLTPRELVAWWLG